MAINTMPGFMNNTMSGQVSRLKAGGRTASGAPKTNPYKTGDMTHQQGGGPAQPYSNLNPTFGGPLQNADAPSSSGSMFGGNLPPIPGGGFTGGMNQGRGPNPRDLQVTTGGPLTQYSPPSPVTAPPLQTSQRPSFGGGNMGGGGMGGRIGRAGGMNLSGIPGKQFGAFRPGGPTAGGGGGGMNTGPGNMVSGTPMAYSMVGGVPVPYGNTIDFYKTLMTRGMDIMDPNTFTPETLGSLGYGY